jgi:hypothetical protein
MNPQGFHGIFIQKKSLQIRTLVTANFVHKIMKG